MKRLKTVAMSCLIAIAVLGMTAAKGGCGDTQLNEGGFIVHVHTPAMTVRATDIPRCHTSKKEKKLKHCKVSPIDPIGRGTPSPVQP